MLTGKIVQTDTCAYINPSCDCACEPGCALLNKAMHLLHAYSMNSLGCQCICDSRWGALVFNDSVEFSHSDHFWFCIFHKEMISLHPQFSVIISVSQNKLKTEDTPLSFGYSRNSLADSWIRSFTTFACRPKLHYHGSNITLGATVEWFVIISRGWF